jgi:predicted nucleotidyltransferase
MTQYAAADRVNWGEAPMEMMEHLLTLPQAPYADALPALRALVDARERRKLGVPREMRILRALSAVRDRIKVMFIFGSYARGEQDADSDIDLLIIGDVSLRELTPGLKQAEHEMGRQVNIAVYSEKEWRERRLDGNPFVTDVLKGQKVFIIGGPDELGAVGG